MHKRGEVCMVIHRRGHARLWDRDDNFTDPRNKKRMTRTTIMWARHIIVALFLLNESRHAFPTCLG